MHKLDEKLWKEFLENPGEDSFVPIFEGTRNLVYTVCHRLLGGPEEAADALQGTYARLLVLVANPREVARVTDWEAHLCRLARLEADRLRKKTRRRAAREVAMGDIPETSSGANSPREIAAMEETRARVRELIGELPEVQRIALQLYHDHDLTQKQIAEALGIPQGTVATRLRAGKARLRELCRERGLGDVSALLVAGGLGGGLLSAPATLTAMAVYTSASAMAASGAVGMAGTGWLASLVKAPVLLAVSVCIPVAIILGVALYDGESREGAVHGGLNESAVVQAAIEGDSSIDLEGSHSPNVLPVSGENDAASVDHDVYDRQLQHSPWRTVSRERREGFGVLGRTLKLTGMVRDEEGAAISDALVELLHMRPSTGDPAATVQVGHVKTDEEGRYTLEAPLSTISILSVSADGFEKAQHILQHGFQLAGGEPSDQSGTFNVVLRRGHTLEGQVVDESGHPIEGAAIHAWTGGSSSENPEILVRKTISNSEGEFRFHGLHRGGWRLIAVTNKERTASLDVYIPSEPVELRLPNAPASISGFVMIKASGDRVEGATVTLFARPQTEDLDGNSLVPVATTLSGPNGVYQFGGLAPANYVVLGRHGGLSSDMGLLYATLGETLEPGHEIMGHLVELTGGITITGRVLDGETDHPLEGAVVSLPPFIREMVEFTGRLSDTTGVDGVYQMEGLPAQAMMLEPEVAWQGFQVQEIREGGFDEAMWTLTRDILMVGHQGEVTGIVYLPDGSPAPGVRVHYSVQYRPNSQGMSTQPSARTNEEGRYRLPEITGETMRVRASHEQYPEAYSDLIHSAAPDGDLNIRFEEGSTLTVRVLDGDDSPVAGAKVSLLREVSMLNALTLSSTRELLTDREGRVAFERLASDPHRVTYSHEETIMVEQPRVALPMEEELVIRVEGGVDFRGIVRDGNGDPVAGARASLMSIRGNTHDRRTATTDGEGRFSLGGFHTGDTINLTLEKDGAMAIYNHLAYTREEQEFVLHLDETTTLLVTVVDKESGEPISDAEVETSHSPGKLSVDKLDDNVHEITGIPPGSSLVLSITAPGYASLQRERIQAPANPTEMGRVYQLSREKTLTGRVVSVESGQPIPGSQVRLEHIWVTEEIARTTTDADGRFRLAGINHSEYALTITRPGSIELHRFPVRFWDGDSKDVGDLEHGGIHVISGRMVDAAGNPVSNHELKLSLSRHHRDFTHLRTMQSSFNAVRTDPNGAFEFRNIPTANVTIQYGDPEISRHLGLIDKSISDLLITMEGETITLDIVLQGGGISRFSLGGREEIEGIQIRGETDASGRSILKQIPPGPYGVSLIHRQTSGTRHMLSVSYTIEVKRGGDNHFTLEVPTSQLHVRLVTPEGEPASEIHVNMRNTSGVRHPNFFINQMSASTRAEGTLNFDGMAPGPWVLEHTQSDGEVVQLGEVEVIEGLDLPAPVEIVIPADISTIVR